MYEELTSVIVFCGIGMVLGQGIDYETTSVNVCTDTFEIHYETMIQCVLFCKISSACLGVIIVGGTTCHGCSAIEVPDQTHVAGTFYRSTDDSSMTFDMVSDVNDSQITASSTYDVHNTPQRGRLNTVEGWTAQTRGGWLPKTRVPYAEYIQVCSSSRAVTFRRQLAEDDRKVSAREDGNRHVRNCQQVRFDDIKEVFEIGTQGRNFPNQLQCVTSYQVSYSIDCDTFSIIKGSDNVNMIFPGNYDQDTIVWNALPKSVLAVCVRISVINYLFIPAMRFGVKGRSSFP